MGSWFSILLGIMVMALAVYCGWQGELPTRFGNLSASESPMFFYLGLCFAIQLVALLIFPKHCEKLASFLKAKFRQT